VVEEDAVAGVQAVAVAVVLRDPVGVELGRGVGALRQEGGGLGLRRRGGAVELGGAGLVEAGLALQPQDADGFQEPERPRPSALAVYSGVSKLTLTWLWAARL
jgi:hypothetical protein